jgi:predicted  nucleic acid-binding Zn-ribbon protein
MAAEQLQQLLHLQEKDRKRMGLEKELRHLPEKRNALEAKRAASAHEVELARNGIKHMQVQIHEFELDVEGLKAKARRYKSQQMEVRNNESYRALEGEIADVEKQASAREDQVLMMMEQVELLKATLAGKEANAAEVAAATEAELTRLREREEQVRRDLEQLEEERRAFTAGVDEVWLSRYESILRNKGDFALVGVEPTGICGGCHMKLPPSQVMSSKNLNQITTCSYCGRILYFRSVSS